MHEELLRHLVPGRKQHGGPVDAVEPKDVLREQVVHDGPELGLKILALTRVGQRAQVVDERVGPDVGDLALVPRQRDAPGLACARDAEVLEPAGDEGARLVEPEPGQHEV